MKNFWQPGEVLELTAPAAGVVSGIPIIIGDLLVVPAVTAAVGIKFNALIEGVIRGAKVVEEAWTDNKKIYWDDTAKKFTTVVGANKLVGTAVGPTPVDVSIATTAAVGDMTVVGLVLTVLNFGNLDTANPTITVTINGVPFVLTEEVEWNAAVSNDATATSIASAINALTGVNATATTNVVTVTRSTGIPRDAQGQAALSTAEGLVRLDGIVR